AAAGRAAVLRERAGHAGSARLAGAGRPVRGKAVGRLVAAAFGDRLRVVGARVAGEYDHTFDGGLRRFALERGHGPLKPATRRDLDPGQVKLREAVGADVRAHGGVDRGEVRRERLDDGRGFCFSDLL